MKITLIDEEIRKILANAISEKTNYVNGEAKADNCFFTVFDDDGKEIEENLTIEFTWTGEKAEYENHK